MTSRCDNPASCPMPPFAMSHSAAVARRRNMNTLASLVQSVPDLDAATTLYRAWLGVEPHTTAPYYVGFNADGMEFGLAPARDGDPASPVPYIGVDDIEAALARVVAAGGTHRFGPQDVGGGTTIASFTDAAGAVLGLITRRAV